MRPTISVIIPTFNRAPELERLLKNLLSQTDPPDQVVVVDDHSTDLTKSVTEGLSCSSITYVKNDGRYQRDGKKTGIRHAKSEYLCFLDDDVIIEDVAFFAKIRPLLKKDTVIQAKAVMENLGKTNIDKEAWSDFLAVRPYPVLEVVLPNYNTGQKNRRIYPLIEFGNFWHRDLASYFIDNNFTLDAFGESYASSLRLYLDNIPMVLVPSLVIRHPGATKGGSQRFNKKTIIRGLTEFHKGYFYNMIYIHSRYYPWFVWLWLPFYALKSGIGLLSSRDLKKWRQYSFNPMREAVVKFLWRRDYA